MTAVRRRVVLGAVLWGALVLFVAGPLLVEGLDGRGWTGTLFGLPVIVTEAALLLTLWLTPLLLVGSWRRTRTLSSPSRGGGSAGSARGSGPRSRAA